LKRKGHRYRTVKVSHCVVDSERLNPVNLGDGVNHVNLSTDVGNTVANNMLRVLLPVSFSNARVPGDLSTPCGIALVNWVFTWFTCSLSWAAVR